MFKRLLMIGVVCLSVIAVCYPVKPAWGFIRSSGFCRCGWDCFDCKSCPQLTGCTAYNLEGLLNLLAGIPCSEAFAGSENDWKEIIPIDIGFNALLGGLGSIDSGSKQKVISARIENAVIEFNCLNRGKNSYTASPASVLVQNALVALHTIPPGDATNGRFDWYDNFPYHTRYDSDGTHEGQWEFFNSKVDQDAVCKKLNDNWSAALDRNLEVDEFQGTFLVEQTDELGGSVTLSQQVWHCKELPRSHHMDCQLISVFEIH
jgi:hypothetical protein